MLQLARGFFHLEGGGDTSSEMSALTRTAQHHIPKDGILHSHRRENLKSSTALTGWALWRRRYVFLVKYELGFYIPKSPP
jgi:hypothetical protein